MKNTVLLFGAIIILSFTSCSESVKTEDNYDQVTLPDGSEVFLNKYTRIQYKGDFENERKVFLEGEAYFKVTHQEAPFLINTVYGEVLITGTELDVDTKDGAMAVEVEEGAVEVNTGKVKKTVKKGERAVTRSANDIETGKAQRNFKKWLLELEQTLNKAGKKAEKGIQKGGKAVEKGAKKAEKKLDKIFK